MRLAAGPRRFAAGSSRFAGKIADDPRGEQAIQLWLDQKDDLLAGRRPRTRTGAATVAYVVNHFLTHKRDLLTAGELAQRTFDRYYSTASLIVATFGKNRSADDLGPDDFQGLRAIMARRWGPVALANEVQIVRSIFKHAVDAGVLAVPIRFGPGFKKPSAKTLRIVRSAKGSKAFSAADLRATLEKADTNMRAMLLLGINGALGNTDLALLPIKAINLAGGWLDYPRPKTGIPRRIKLWPQTVAAIRTCLDERKQPIDPADEDLLFISPHRRLNYIGKHKGYRVTAAMTRLMKLAKLQDPRTFYDLRRTFQTVAEGARDLTAVQSVMGHAPGSGDMSALYRQSVDDDRLEAVSEHVRDWLFPPKKSKPRRKAK